MEKRVLGKGLSALIPDKADLSEPIKVSDYVAYVKTANVFENPFQPRINYDDARLNELVASIKEKGVLQPILVRERSSGGYEVIAGERRLRAARALNLDEVPVFIKKATDQEAFVLALVENIQREELNPIEEALAFKRLVEDFTLSQEDLAKSVGKDRTTISNTLRLLKLPQEIQASVVSGELSMGHARALVSIENPEEQKALFQQVIQRGMSVREVENFIKTETDNPLRRKKRKPPERSHELIFIEEDLQQTLGTKVRILPRKKRGKIVIEYYSPEDLERIIELIKS